MVLTNAGEIYTCGSNSRMLNIKFLNVITPLNCFGWINLDGQLGLGYANGPNQTKFCVVEMLKGFPCALITAGTYLQKN